MKNTLVYLLLLITTHTTHANSYNKVIIPLSTTDIQNDSMKMEISSIMNGSSEQHLKTYKATSNKNFVHCNKWSWDFYISFSDATISTAKGQAEYYAQPPAHLLTNIGYAHVKYNYTIDSASFATINKEVGEYFTNQPITSKVTAYISNNRRRHYLHISIESTSKKLSYIFIITNSMLYQCAHIKQEKM